MNVTSVADVIMKQMVCSSYARSALTQDTHGFPALLTTEEAKDDYLCDCCLVPCAKCEAGLDNGGDLDAGNIASVISSRMGELTDPSKAKELFSPSGANGDTFSTNAFWEQATKYFNQLCLP